MELETLVIAGVDCRETWPHSVPPGGSVQTSVIWVSEVAPLLDGRQRTFRAPNQAGTNVTVTIPDRYGIPAGAAQAVLAAAGRFVPLTVTENLSGQGMRTWTGFVEDANLEEIIGAGRGAFRGTFRLRVEE